MKGEAVLPLAVLVVLSVAAASALHMVTGGAEIGDDAPRLLWMCLHPWVLFGDYRAAGLWDTWGSFPPLLPALFGLPIRPASDLTSPFVAIRFGALAWTAACLLATASAARATTGAGGSPLRLILLAFALLPPVWMAAAVLPQEEAYVALFALAIHRAAHARATRWLLPLFVVTALAGKYFLLILMLPVAFHLGRPLVRLAVWVPLVVGLLAAWVGYHFVAHGLTPILSHNVDPDASVSVWALLWNLGVQPPIALLKPASVLLCVAAVAGLCVWSRGLSLTALMAASLLITLLGLSISFPGYVIWALPLTLLASLEMGRGDRLRVLGLLGVWGCGELLANASRGVALALETSRGVGKEAVAQAVTRWLGADVPLALLESMGILAVLVSGALLVALLVRGQERRGRAVMPGVLALLAVALVPALASAHGVADGDQLFIEGSTGNQIGPFIYLGAKHMVTGYDHLLFLVGVIFFLYRLRDVVTYVSLFALGHSITLLLGVLSGIHVNPFVIDAIIGLSVVYKGIDNLGFLEKRLGFQPNTKAAVLLFGLAHGLGLATKLQDFSLDSDGLIANLIAFNVGVEAGQFLALGVILIAMGYWRRTSSFQRHARTANYALVVAGFALTAYQVYGYFHG